MGFFSKGNDSIYRTASSLLSGVRIKKKPALQDIPLDVAQPQERGMRASTITGSYHRPIMNFIYDGEKNPGEIGIPKRLFPDFRTMQVRSWQLYLTSDVTKAIIDKYVKWVVGSGLRLQAQPATEILNQENIEVPEEFSNNVENRFALWANSKEASLNQLSNLHKQAANAYKNITVGGDALVVIIRENSNLMVQVIDGEKIFTPAFESAQMIAAMRRGNRIEHGIEINKRGEHVAYYVQDRVFEMQRVQARTTRGLLVAWMIYGDQYRVNDRRGIPKTVAAMESLSKLDRYKEATVGSAEERQKIAYFIEHDLGGTGESPLTENLKNSLSLNRKVSGASADPDPDVIHNAANIATTTNKQAFNLTPGATIKSPSSDMELNFPEFFITNLQPICAAMGIPIEVALSKFDSNFSASRAAMKEWEHTLDVQRKTFSDQFYLPIYQMWLLNEDEKGTVNAPGLFMSKIKGKNLVFKAYTNSRFTGASVPHVDPVKEANAERIKLGDQGKNIPLTTPQRATEALDGGDYDRNVERFNEDVKKVDVQEPTESEPVAKEE